MWNRSSSLAPARCAAAVTLLLATTALAVQPSPGRVHGELSEIDGLRVLRVWGTPEERGLAHGTLLGRDIVALLDGYIAGGTIAGGAQGYEERLLPMLGMMKIAPKYRAELRGILAGIEAQAGGPVQVPSLDRALRYDDLVAMNCLSDVSSVACSSFAVWDSMSADGGTITGRNLDWHASPVLHGTQIIIAFVPPDDDSENGWVSATWPGLIGCLTGMNARGVTVSLHDVNAGPPEGASGFVPRGLALRDAIELAGDSDPVRKMAHFLGRFQVAAASNVMVSMPHRRGAKNAPAAVLEHAGRLNADYDFTIRFRQARYCDGTWDDFICCTNHYARSGSPDVCERYRIVDDALVQRGAERKPLDVKAAWRLLRGVQMPRPGLESLVTYQSIVFEPNKRRMHVAFSQDGKPAPECRKVTLDLDQLSKVPGRANSP